MRRTDPRLTVDAEFFEQDVARVAQEVLVVLQEKYAALDRIEDLLPLSIEIARSVLEKLDVVGVGETVLGPRP